MDLALHFACAYPSIIQGFMSAKSTNHLPVRGNRNSLRVLTEFRQIADTPLPRFVLQKSCFKLSLSRIMLHEKAYSLSSTGRSKKGSVCCKKAANTGASNPSISNREEIISLLKRIQSSISKGESQGVEEKKNSDVSSESKPLTKAIVEVLDKSRKKTEGGTSVNEERPKKQVEVPRPLSGFVKKTSVSSASGPRGKLPVDISDKALGEMTKEEKASLIETMKLAELKEVAKNRGIRGYSKLRKSELLELIKSS